MPSLYIVSPKDRPVFDISYPHPPKTGKNEVLEQLVIHAALDMVDEKIWKTKDMYLAVVDKFNDQPISAYVTPSNYRFMLLHDGRSEETVRTFFSDIHDLFSRFMLNPLHSREEQIQLSAFRERVLMLIRRHL